MSLPFEIRKERQMEYVIILSVLSVNDVDMEDASKLLSKLRKHCIPIFR
jgi:hypothetical protein